MPARKKQKGPAPEMPRLPPMPYQEPPGPHQEKRFGYTLPLAMVAQLIPSKQIDDPKTTVSGKPGRQVVQEEWANLQKRVCWNFEAAKPLCVVVNNANRDGLTIHIGSMLELLYKKHSEFDPKLH